MVEEMNVNPEQPQITPKGVVQKLTDWKNEPTLASLKEDLSASKPYHDTQEAKITKWTEILNASGSQRPKKIPGRSSVQPKVARRQAEWRYSALTEPFLATDKIFKVYPRTFEDEQAAKQNDLVLNWQFNTKINKVKFIDDFVRTTVDEGTCIVKLGWIRQTKVVEKEVPIFDYYPVENEQELQLLQQASQLKYSDPRTFNEQASEEVKASVQYMEQSGIPVSAVQVGTTIEPEEQIIQNEPSVEILNLSNVYIDPSCNGNFDKALFVIYSFETNKAELLKEGNRYKNLDKVDWNTSDLLSEPDHESPTPETFNFKDKSRKKVVAYEYWGYYDINGDGSLVPFVATWIGNVLIRMELNPFPDEKLPFVLVQYLPVKRQVYGEPDAELLEDNQKIIGAVTRGMIDLMGRSANSQQGFAKGMLDPLNKKRFNDGLDYEFNPQVNPAGGGFIEHKYPEIPQSAIAMVQMQNAEAEALTGIKAFSGGLAGDAYNSKVATAIQGVLDAAAKREMSILRRLAKGICQIGYKIIAMNGEFLSDNEVIRVTNKQYIQVSHEDLKGNFDLEVDINTYEVDNEKAQDLSFILQTLGPNGDPKMVMEILAEIVDLKRMPVLAEKLRNWQPPQDPVAEQVKQLELQRMQMEIQKLQAEVQKIQAEAQTEGSRAQTEAVKAQIDMANAKSNADKIQQEASKVEAEVLNTLADTELTKAKTQSEYIKSNMEASGISHIQDMEKMRAQAQGNQNLEVTKALLKSKKPEESEPDIDSAIGFNSISNDLANSSY